MSYHKPSVYLILHNGVDYTIDNYVIAITTAAKMGVFDEDILPLCKAAAQQTLFNTSILGVEGSIPVLVKALITNDVSARALSMFAIKDAKLVLGHITPNELAVRCGAPIAWLPTCCCRVYAPV